MKDAASLNAVRVQIAAVRENGFVLGKSHLRLFYRGWKLSESGKPWREIVRSDSLKQPSPQQSSNTVKAMIDAGIRSHTVSICAHVLGHKITPAIKEGLCFPFHIDACTMFVCLASLAQLVVVTQLWIGLNELCLRPPNHPFRPQK